MSIGAVNSVSFSGKRDNIDAFINLDDNAIRHVAMAKTRQNVDFDAHKKRSAALLMALPLADGLAAASALPKGLRLHGFAAGTGVGALFWGGMLGTLGLLNHIEKKNEKVGNFVERHPILSFVGSAFAAYFAGKKIGVLGSDLFNKALGTKTYAKVSAKAADLFKKAKGVKFVNTGLEKLAEGRKFVGNKISKLPSALKETLKVAASWAPLAAVVGTLAESISFRKSVANEFNYNYADLKEKQLNLAKHRNAELKA